jgi:DNA (cytosine-5)-methyltransferase 1
MIANIPPNAADHNTNVQFDSGPKRPYSGQNQAKTLTCKGGDNYHPSGMRPFTVRELASLQTFPLYHSFAGARGITAARQQIGNAVPPVLARALFRTIIKALKEADGVS